MAGTIADELLIKIGINLDDLKAGLNQAVNQIKNKAKDLGTQSEDISKGVASGQKAVSEGIKNTALNTERAIASAQKGSQAFGQMTSMWGGAITSMLRTIAAPLAGALSLGSVMKSYFGGVAQVAQMTGQYSQKMEEWQKKRALLARVNREDIELYKKGREATLKFQISMADLSTTIMRAASPAIKWLIEGLTNFANWIDRNQNNIVRFLQITAGVITTLLIPAFIKLAAAILMNPLTWIIGLIVGLIGVIDDLIVWLHGGESALDSFWEQFGSREEVLRKIQDGIQWLSDTFDELTNGLILGISTIVKWFSDFWSSADGTARVVDSLKNAFKALGTVFDDIKIIWNELVAMLSDNGFLDDLKDAFDNALTVILGAFNLFFAGIQAIFGLIKGVLTGDWDSFTKAADKAIEAVKDIFRGLWNVVKDVFNQIWEFTKDIFGKIASRIAEALTPDFLKSTEKNREALKGYDPMSASPPSAYEAGTAASNVTNSSKYSRSDSRSTVNNITVNTNSKEVGRAIVQEAQESADHDYDTSPSAMGVNP